MVKQLWERKWQSKKLSFSTRECKKIVTKFCAKHKIQLSTLVWIFEKIGIKMPMKLTHLRGDTFCMDDGRQIILNPNPNPDMISHIIIVEDNVRRGYDLSGDKNKLIVELKNGERLSCTFGGKRGYNIYLQTMGYITVKEFVALRDRLKLPKEIYDEICLLVR